MPPPHGDLAGVDPLSILASIAKEILEKLFLVKVITLSWIRVGKVTLVKRGEVRFNVSQVVFLRAVLVSLNEGGKNDILKDAF